MEHWSYEVLIYRRGAGWCNAVRPDECLGNDLPELLYQLNDWEWELVTGLGNDTLIFRHKPTGDPPPPGFFENLLNQPQP